MVRVALIAAVLVALAPALAHADTDYFAHAGDSSTVRVRQPKHRTAGQRGAIYGLLGGAAVSLGVGLYFHWDSYQASKEVTANHDLIEGIWTPERQATYDRAESSGTVAIVGYSLSAAFALGAMVATYLTHPGEEMAEIHPTTTVSVTHGGAVIAREWRF